MGKKSVTRAVLLVFIASLFCAVVVSASYKELMHEEWHMHEDNFTLDNNKFIVKAGGDPTKVVISVKDKVLVIANDTCQDTMNMSICLTDVEYPSEDLHRLIGIEEYEYEVQVWYYMANLTIDKQIEERQILIGEKIRVEIVIENEGSLPARGIYFRDVYFSDNYPDFFISNVIGCTYSKHNISWNGTLKPTQKKICSYDLEAVRSTTFSSQAKVTYLVGIANKTKTTASEKITLVVPDYELTLNRTLNTTSVEVGEEVMFNFSVENTLDDKKFTNVIVSTEIPKGLELLEYSGGVTPSGNTLRWSGTIDNSVLKNFSARFKVIHGGNNTIKTNINYNIGHLVRVLDEFDTVFGIMDELKLQYIEFPDDSESGSSSRIVVNVNNPSSKNIFKNVKVDISTNLPESFESLLFEEIGKKQFKNIINKNFTLPIIEGDTTYYKLTFNINYKSEYGQEMHLSEINTITVNSKSIEKTLTTSSESSSKKEKGIQDQKIEESLGRFRDKLVELVEKVNTSNTMGPAIIILVLFIVSVIHFVKKMVAKVKEYESYEKGGD